MAVSLRARDMIRFAKKNNMTVKRWSRSGCALGIVTRMCDIPEWSEDDTIMAATGRSKNDIIALECGFEGWEGSGLEKNRYFKVGQRVAELAGLNDKAN